MWRMKDMIVKLNFFKRLIIKIFGKRIITEKYYSCDKTVEHVAYQYKGIIYILGEVIKDGQRNN